MAYSKKLIVFLFAFLVLFFINVSTCFAQWTDAEWLDLVRMLTVIRQNQSNQITELEKNNALTESQLNVVTDIKSQLAEVKTTLSNIETYQSWTVTNLEAVNTKLNNISTQIDTLAKSILNIEQYSQWTVENLEAIKNRLDTISSQIQAKQDEIKNEVTQQGTNINNSINNVDSSINNSDVSADASSLPTDNTTDLTSEGFNNIFAELYNTFTSGSAKDLVLTIPFTGKSFTINVANVYGNANLGFVKTLIQLFWYFVISYFIVQDVGKKINKIKSGNIEDVQMDNVKEDLL